MKTLPGLDTQLADADYAQLFGKKVFQRMIVSPDPQCKNCGGITKLFFDVPNGKAQSSAWLDGKWMPADLVSFPCPLCSDPADQQKIMMARLECSGLKPSEYDYSIGYIDGKEGKEYLYRAVKSIADHIVAPGGFYFIYGDYGVGKSGTLMSLIAAACRRGVSAYYTTAENILEETRNTFNTNKYDDGRETSATILDRYRRFSILVIDELGEDRMSDTQWALSKMFGVIDERYRDRLALCTLTVSNSTPDQLNANPRWKYFENRTRDGIRIPVGGECLRGKK